ncbi:ABC transporter ATP-binding protein [Halalkalibacter flavus]|jgi:iron(III) transport system ATP-binding protein|uniref:ABC transporter ATP-binding protein n=1 Tax=Halalkalibacter flavus TaxID=3090668 RepID=UPI002FCA673B
MSFIQLKQLTKLYKKTETPAVDTINLDIEKGEIITLLGPSGCGKTTTLRMIAGFEQPTSGSITIDHNEVYSDKTYLPPEKRGIGMVFQDYALFPHLTIEKNVTFGLNKWSNRAKKERAQEVLELVGLAEYGKRYPNELSGGQQQRVALARALAPRPHVVLMDEPFSNLDAGLRERMRYDVTVILRKANTTAIIVTHDQKDAFAVSDRVVVMNQGVIQQIASPREMYRCPKNCFVAQFVGKTNLLEGTLCSDLKHVDTYIGRVSLPTQSEKLLEDVRVSIRPEGCRLAENGRYSGTVERVTYGGEYQEVEVRLGDHHEASQPMVVYAPIEQDIEIGSVVSFDIKAELVALVEA